MAGDDESDDENSQGGQLGIVTNANPPAPSGGGGGGAQPPSNPTYKERLRLLIEPKSPHSTDVNLPAGQVWFTCLPETPRTRPSHRFSLAVGQDRLNFTTCLLYTSDAADERSSVDLG